MKNIEVEEDIKGQEIRFVDEERQDAFLDMFGAVEEGDDDDDGETFEFGDVQFGTMDDEDSGSPQKQDDDLGEVDFGAFVFSDSPEKEKTPSPLRETKISIIREIFFIFFNKIKNFIFSYSSSFRKNRYSFQKVCFSTSI